MVLFSCGVGLKPDLQIRLDEVVGWPSGQRGVGITTKVIVCAFYIIIGFMVLLSRGVGLKADLQIHLAEVVYM